MGDVFPEATREVWTSNLIGYLMETLSVVTNALLFIKNSLFPKILVSTLRLQETLFSEILSEHKQFGGSR